MNWLEKILLPEKAAAQVVERSNSSGLSENFTGTNQEGILAIQENLSDFLFWGFASATIISIVLLISITQKFEEVFDPTLHRIKKFAPFIMQSVLGLALLQSAFFGSLFAADVPLETVFGGTADIIQVVLGISGAMLLFGILPKLVGLVVVVLFIPFIATAGLHALTFATHLGEAVTLLFLGGTYQIIQSKVHVLPKFYRSLELHLHKYKFLIVRISFGIALILTALYVNYFNGVTALNTLTESSLVTLFPFDPTFLVIGALVIEILLGIFFIIGFEIRFSAVMYMFFLIASIIFFQETAWSHIILIGTCIAMFTHGYDQYTIGGSILKRGNLEPIL